jgi:catechol 2,3-dioxygenase-like lactoylglutathione lyase family enzyme
MGEARHDPSDLITRLVPILVVRDLDAERAFYEALGLRVTYEGPEYPDFIGLGNEAVEFGLERPKSPSDTPRADGGPARDANGEPARDANGEPARDADGEPARDANGEPARDANGEPARDADGEPARDANGEPARERVLTWQLGVTNADEAVARCEAAGLAFTIEVHEPRPDWRYRTLKLRSPSGFDVVLEGPSEPG